MGILDGRTAVSGIGWYGDNAMKSAGLDRGRTVGGGEPATSVSFRSQSFEEFFAWFAVAVRHVQIQLDTQTRFVRYGDLPILDHGAMGVLDKVVEKGNAGGMPFERQNVGDGGRKMHARHRAERAADVVERQVHIVEVGEVGQLTAVPQANFLDVRRQYAQTALGDEAFKIEAQIMIFASGDGCPRVALYRADGANVFGRYWIFQPHQFVFFDGARQIDGGLHAVVPVAIDGQADLRADSGASGGNE